MRVLLYRRKEKESAKSPAADKKTTVQPSKNMFEARREATKSTKPLKNIDDIKSFREMLALFELLSLPFDPESLNLAQMKKEAKAKIEEQSSARAQYSNGTTGFIISKAKERDMLIRRELKKTYSEVDDCLAKFDEDVFSIVNSYNEDYDILKIHNEQKERLEKHDYLLLLTGNWHYFKIRYIF